METSPRRASTSSSTEESDSSTILLDQAARGHETRSDRGLNENLAGYLSDLAVLSSRARCQPNAAEIITQAITLVRSALKADYCALYEVASGTRRFVMRQGCGWRFNLLGEFELDDIIEADDSSALPFMTDGLVPDVTSGLFGFMRSHHVDGGVNARIESAAACLACLRFTRRANASLPKRNSISFSSLPTLLAVRLRLNAAPSSRNGQPRSKQRASSQLFWPIPLTKSVRH